MSEGYGKGGVGFGLIWDQLVEMIVCICIDNGIIDYWQIVYVLVMVQYELCDFVVFEEDWGRKQVVDLCYFGGEEYFGWGFVYFIYVNNYEWLGEVLGMGCELVEYLEWVVQVDIVIKVLVVGMCDGLFGVWLFDNVNVNYVDYWQVWVLVNGGELNNGSFYLDVIVVWVIEWEFQVVGLVQCVQ